MTLWLWKTDKLSGLFASFELVKEYLDNRFKYEVKNVISTKTITKDNINFKIIYEIIVVINGEEVRGTIKSVIKKILHTFTEEEINDAFFSREKGINLVYSLSNKSNKSYKLFLTDESAFNFIKEKIGKKCDNNLDPIKITPWYCDKFFKIYRYPNGKCIAQERFIDDECT